VAGQQTSCESLVEFSVVIANWNGAAFLARCLSSVLLSARRTQRTFELLVVDDASTDASAEIVRQQFPQVRLLARNENLGFAHTVNEGVASARGRHVILLNNDVAVRESFCSAVLGHFEREDEALFGVTAKTVEWDGRKPNYVKMDAVWQRGDLRLVWSDPQQAEPTLFLQAGACAFVRERFLELGGLEEFFAPAYWEDFDLSWRALARGWRNIYEPASPAYHLGKASFRRLYGGDLLRHIVERNHLLFLWSNLSDMRLIASHCLWLPIRVASEILSGHVNTLRALLKALPTIGEIMRCRRRRAHLRLTSDAAILRSIDTGASRFSEP